MIDYRSHAGVRPRSSHQWSEAPCIRAEALYEGTDRDTPMDSLRRDVFVGSLRARHYSAAAILVNITETHRQ